MLSYMSVKLRTWRLSYDRASARWSVAFGTFIEAIHPYWKYSGLEFVWRQLGGSFLWGKVTGRDPTLLIWLFGIYVAAYGLASQRHENHRDRIDNKIATLAAQLGTSSRNAALARIPELQVQIRIPIEPEFLLPWTSVTALFGDKKVNDELMDEVKLIASLSLLSLKPAETKINYQKLDADNVVYADLDEKAQSDYELEIPAEADNLYLNRIDLSSYSDGSPVDLHGAYLQGTILQDANLQGANLLGAYLHDAYLTGANLQDANLMGADLQSAYLLDANFRDANLVAADLQDAYFGGAKLRAADLQRANLQDARILDCDRLEQADKWQNAQRDKELACGAPIPDDPHDK